MIVTISIEVTIVDGEDKTAFSLTSHRQAGLSRSADPYWTRPEDGGDGPPPSIVTQELGDAMVASLSDMVRRAEGPEVPDPDWNDSGNPQRVP